MVADWKSIWLAAQRLWDSTEGPWASPLPRCPPPTSNCHGSKFVPIWIYIFFFSLLFEDACGSLFVVAHCLMEVANPCWKQNTDIDLMVWFLAPCLIIYFTCWTDRTEVISSHHDSQCRFCHCAECKAGQLVLIVTQSCFKYRFFWWINLFPVFLCTFKFAQVVRELSLGPGVTPHERGPTYGLNLYRTSPPPVQP